MKTQVFLALFAGLAVFASAEVEVAEVFDLLEVVDAAEQPPVEPTAAASRNINVGSISDGDRLLHRDYYIRNPINMAIQSQYVNFRDTWNTRITAIQINEVGTTQYATARIASGGVGNNFANIQLQTARSNGFYFLVEIYGR